MAEYVTDKMPQYVYNKHTTYENTVLQEHVSIVSGMKDISAVEALIENQGRLFIGLCMKGMSNKFIDDNFDKYYKTEYEKLSYVLKDGERRNMAFNRTWLRIINEAMDYFMNKYKVDGSKAKIAIVDEITSDGRRIIEPDDVTVDFSDE